MKNRFIRPALFLITLVTGAASASPLDDLRNIAIDEVEQGLRLQIASVSVSFAEGQLLEQIQQQQTAMHEARKQARKAQPQGIKATEQGLSD